MDVRRLAEAIEEILSHGKSHDLACLREAGGGPEFLAALRKLESIYRFSLALSKGDLSARLSEKGALPGALKALQASLRHLTWQTRRIADGDFSQQVDFLGEFSEAFNRMTLRLKETNEALRGREAELERGNSELERINGELQERLLQIQRLQEDLREEAIRDPLTGLYNRRFLNEVLPRELVRAGREGRQVGLLMADIDHFKQVNDTYGHPAGDLVLLALSALLRERTRAGDVSCRYGGEEFIMVMPGANLDVSSVRAELIREEFSQIGVVTEEAVIRVTISIGVAESPRHGREQAELVRMADQALYSAKALGRNRVIRAIL